MIPRLMLSVLVLGALVLLTPSEALAGKVPGIRTSGMRDPGVRGDQGVPYLTSGNSAFFTTYVAPEIYHMPQMDNRQFPGAKRVYNLPFYNGVTAFGDFSQGATWRMYPVSKSSDRMD